MRLEKNEGKLVMNAGRTNIYNIIYNHNLNTYKYKYINYNKKRTDLPIRTEHYA